MIGTIATTRDGHPDIPFVVCSPIWSPERETTPNAVEMTLQIMREEVEEAVESFRGHGDTQLHYVDGLKLFDESLVKHLPDGLHPSGIEPVARPFPLRFQVLFGAPRRAGQRPGRRNGRRRGHPLLQHSTSRKHGSVAPDAA